jgi:hypothetical protein
VQGCRSFAALRRGRLIAYFALIRRDATPAWWIADAL